MNLFTDKRERDGRRVVCVCMHFISQQSLPFELSNSRSLKVELVDATDTTLLLEQSSFCKS